MEVRINRFFLSVLVSLVALVSCVQEANDGSQRLDGTVADLSGQVASLNSSLEQLNALQNVVEQDLSELSAEIEAHIGYLKSGVSRLDGTMATLQLQKNVAMVVAELQAAGYSSSVTQFVKSVKSWLGKSFETYFDVLVYACASQTIVEGAAFQLGEHHSYVDAVLSDVEAGLRDGVPAEELATVLETLAADLTSATELNSKVDEILLGLETECVMAVEALFDESSSYDASALKKASTQARIQLKSAEPTISDLVSRIETIESAIETINTNLSELRADVNELLGMIQSLTFVSEYSDDKAVAYYEMTDNVDSERASEGKKQRVPAATFDLTFLVRPASVADALAQTWQESLSVVGYYANRIQQQAVANIQNFEIANVVATHGKGLLTVTVNNAFDDEFYFKEKGAMLALAVESGKNNCASKFVEIVPRDITGKVYAESIELTPTTLSIQNGDTYKFVAKVTPSNVTDQGFVWEDYDSEYVTVDENGQLTATAVGNSQVMVAANATDEFGRKLSATCNVTVTPAIRIVGPQSVEIGESAVMSIESPNYINPNDVIWELEWAGNSAYVGLTDNGDATCTIEGIMKNFGRPAGASEGAASEYLPINVKCTIGGNAEPVVLMHPIFVTEVQPKAIVIDGLSNDEKKMTIKMGSTYSFNSSIEPAAVNRDLFGIIYQSQSSHVATIDFRSGLLTTVGYGTANISVEVNDKTSESYFFPKRELFQKFERIVAVTVEPYWVVGLSLPRIEEPLAPESTGTFTPIFTSDVVGEQPSVQSLIWDSSNEDVIEVDPETGAYRAKGVGTATITATTTGEWSTKGDPISATCDITVELLENLPTIGDYYYLDGTWSSTYTAGNNPIGVVFAIVDATRTDSMLDTKMDKTTALVVGLNQYNSTFGAFSTGTVSTGKWFVENGYDNANTAATNGYSNSIGLSAYRDAKQSGASGVEDVAFNLTNFPSGTSGWYIPSYYEMKLLYGQKSVINNSLKTRGTEISDDDYWISSLQWTTDGFYDVMSLYPFSMSSGDWGASKDKSTSLPVRVVLAF